MKSIVKYFDKDRNGKISFDEFMRALRGEMNERRLGMVKLAFGQLDKKNRGVVTLNDLLEIYDVTHHPDFISGRKTKEEIMADFMTVWET